MDFETWWKHYDEALITTPANTAFDAWQAAQEADRESSERPAYWLLSDGAIVEYNPETYGIEGTAIGLLYTRPAPARKPLSDEEVEKEFNRRCELDCCPDFSEAVRWAEKAHGIGETE